MKHYIYLLIIALTLSACTAEEDFKNPSKNHETNLHHIALEDAIANATTFLEEISQTGTRSPKKQIKSVVTYNGNSFHTRNVNDSNEVLYYFVNFEEGGFAILGADDRLKPIYAISDEGSLELSELYMNKALSAFISALPKEIQPETRILPGGIVIGGRKAEILTSPLINDFVRTWTQDTYNDSIIDPKRPGVRFPVGCTANAMSQFLSFYKFPINYKCATNDYINHYYTINWETVLNGTNPVHICQLREVLGRRWMFNISYNIHGSYAEWSQQEKVLKNLGYTSVSKSEFDPNIAMNVLRYQKEPILIESHLENPNNSTETDGHSFIIDGLAGLRDITSTQTKYTDYFFHFVWGNAKVGDGYYEFDTVNKTFGPKAYQNATDEGGECKWLVCLATMYYNPTH